MCTLCFLHLHIEISVFHVIKLQNLYKTNLDINTNINASQTKKCLLLYESLARLLKKSSRNRKSGWKQRLCRVNTHVAPPNNLLYF